MKQQEMDIFEGLTICAPDEKPSKIPKKLMNCILEQNKCIKTISIICFNLYICSTTQN